MLDPITRLETLLASNQTMNTPEWLEKRALPESIFARSYEIITDLERARLKTCMAGLFETYPPVSTTVEHKTTTSPSGLDSNFIEKPYDVCVVAFDTRFQSPARLLACLIPAITSRIPLVLVTGIGMEPSQWPAAVVVALELAGIEAVLSLEHHSWKPFLSQLRSSSTVCVITPQNDFFDNPDMYSACCHVPKWQPAMPSGIGIIDADEEIDEDTLCFCHAGEPLHHFKTLEAPAEQGYFPGLFVVSSDFELDTLVDMTTCTVQAGRESEFVWPDLDASFFRYIHRTFLAPDMATLAMQTIKPY